MYHKISKFHFTRVNCDAKILLTKGGRVENLTTLVTIQCMVLISVVMVMEFHSGAAHCSLKLRVAGDSPAQLPKSVYCLKHSIQKRTGGFNQVKSRLKFIHKLSKLAIISPGNATDAI